MSGLSNVYFSRDRGTKMVMGNGLNTVINEYCLTIFFQHCFFVLYKTKIINSWKTIFATTYMSFLSILLTLLKTGYFLRIYL